MIDEVLMNDAEDPVEVGQILEKLEAGRPKWHQIFKMTLTKFEIPVELQVKCDKWEEGLRYVRNRRLNRSLTTRCKDEQEARQQLYEAIWAWFTEPSNGENGALIYWKIFDE